MLKSINPKIEFRGHNYFEGFLINLYYAYNLSKEENINVYSFLGNSSKHKKLINNILDNNNKMVKNITHNMKEEHKFDMNPSEPKKGELITKDDMFKLTDLYFKQPYILYSHQINSFNHLLAS